MVEIIGKYTKKDANGNTFASLKLNQISYHNEVKITTKKTCFYKAMEKSYLDGKPEYGFNNNVGDILEGTIVSKKVEPYNIGSRVVFSFTMFIPMEETEEIFEMEVIRLFEKADRIILSENKFELINTIINQ